MGDEKTADRRKEEAGDDGGILGIGCLAGAAAVGALTFAALVSIWAENTLLTADPEAPPPPAPAAAAPAPEPAAEPTPEVPEGAGVTSAEVDGKPMLSVYFDSGATEVTPDFESVSNDLREYLEANPDAKVAISGFNDPTGDAELNARLSKERAENVQAQLVALGIDEARTDLVKPDDATTTDMSNAEARRVEITVVE
ncbi:MAG: OmpA family protein [Pseudomonadota bacterium]